MNRRLGSGLIVSGSAAVVETKRLTVGSIARISLWPIVLLVLVTMSDDGIKPNSGVSAAPFPSPDSGQSESLRIPLKNTEGGGLEQQADQGQGGEQLELELEEITLDEEGHEEIKNSKFVPEEPIQGAGAPGDIRQYKLRPDSLDLSSISPADLDKQIQGEGEGADGQETDVNASELQLTGDKK